MAKRWNDTGVGRRNFLKGATLASAAALTAPAVATAQTQAPPAWRPRGAQPMNRAAETHVPPKEAQLTTAFTGSDFMVDCFKSARLRVSARQSRLELPRAAGVDRQLRQERSARIPHLHARGSLGGDGARLCQDRGQAAAQLVHGTVGLQHASMAIYNACCDRVPVFVVGGNGADATMRRPGVEWIHTAQDAAAIVRDFVKWDDYPASLQHFAESTVRAYKIATTPPMGPVVLVADRTLQEGPIAEDAELRIPEAAADRAAAKATCGAVAGAARSCWSQPRAPVIIADRCARTPAGLARLVELAELLQVPVVDAGARMNFPTRHPLNQSHRAAAALVAQADVIVGLGCQRFLGPGPLLSATSSTAPRARCSSRAPRPSTIGSGDLFIKSNYQDFQRFAEVDHRHRRRRRGDLADR